MINLGNKLLGNRWASAFALMGALFASACGDDEGSQPPGNADEDAGGGEETSEGRQTSEGAQTTDGATGETGGTLGPGETSEASSGEAGSLDGGETGGTGALDAGGRTAPEADGGHTDAGPTGPGETSWIVGGWLSTEEGYFGYLTIVDDLSADGEIDLENVHQFPGDIAYTSTGDGTVYVGQEGLPTVERWVVNEAGDGVEKDGEISFDYFGVTSTMGSVEIVDEETAWYFDTSTYQVIVFNPTTMTTEGDTIDFSGILEGDNDLALGLVSRLDDSLVISAQYWDTDGNAVSLTRAAIIDIDSHDVNYADDTRCGSTRFHALDASGNLYIGAHPGESLWQAAGLGTEDAPKPCLVRINSGDTEFDTDYYVNLEEVSGGKVVGGFMQGDDNHAYVYEFTGDIGEVNAENYNPQLRGDNWALARIELGNEEESYTLVDNYEPSTSYGSSFTVEVGNQSKRYVISANASFESGLYYDLSNPTDAAPALSFPGFPGNAVNF
jgi:hypothetical protein